MKLLTTTLQFQKLLTKNKHVNLISWIEGGATILFAEIRNLHRNCRYTTNYFILTFSLKYKQSMSVKKIPVFLGWVQFWEKFPQMCFSEADLDNNFKENICDNSQSQLQVLRFSKGSNNHNALNKFAIKFFLYCDLKTQQRLIFQEEIDISNINFFSGLLDKLR